ncbi:Signal transduction histidine kinase [Asanoa hainanensis]|uniref:histidine kinase n=1 Tax=Asanoa hainanensis TaxID=560556 RepID=A0A239K0C1_9ACTN|nr:Signal transduction histidine kinase [Asanoa hainanensis]
MVDRVRALPVLVVDTGIAVLCFVASVLSADLMGGRGSLVLLVCALASLPLVWRRRHPLVVTTFCGIGTVWLSMLGAVDEQPVGQLVATYTFAALCGPVGRMVGVLGTAAGVAVSILVPGGSVRAVSFVGLLFAVAYALGTSARARRDRIALLEERARRHAEEQTAVAAREREAIARDMHDILAHSFSLIAVQAEAGPVLVRPDPARAERAFDVIGDTAREALAQLRQTLGTVRGPGDDLAPQPQLADLSTLVERAGATGLRVTVAQHGRARALPPLLGTAAYRVVQESLTNVVRHANATHVEVGLDWSPDGLRIDVSDDGSPGPATPGNGLIGMRERMTAIGGTLHAGPRTDGAGFRVTALVPLAEAAPDG